LLLVNNLTTAYYCPDNLTVVWIANYLKINNNSKEYYKKKIIDLRANIAKAKLMQQQVTTVISKDTSVRLKTQRKLWQG